MPALKYVGNGAYVPGVPADPETVIEVPEEEAATLIATGLYVSADAEPEPEPQGLPEIIIEEPADEPDLTQEDEPDGE